MLMSLLMRATPSEVRLILIDPKMVELSIFNDIPHLITPVVTDPRKASTSLSWLISEMEERYRKMSKLGVRNIGGYNRKVREAIDAGLYVAHYFLLGGVGENKETLAETLDKADTLEQAALFFFCGMRIYPGTELYRIALKEGQIEANRSILEPVFYRSPMVGPEEIVKALHAKAGGRINWVTGSGGEDTAEIIRRLYKRGHTGPMWDYLIRLS